MIFSISQQELVGRNEGLSLLQLLLPAAFFFPACSRLLGAGQHSGIGHASLQEARLRRLQSSAGTADVAVVHSPEDLWDAVAAGAPHIEIRSHLDITALRDPAAEKHSSLPVEHLRQVQSIRGACAEPWPQELLQRIPQQPPLLARLPGQCLVVTNGTLLQHIGEMWLHNLYMRNVYDRPDSGTLLIRSAPSDLHPAPSALYMTGITAQGSGSNTAFLYVEHMAYVQGCMFSDGGGVPEPGFKGAPPVLVDGAAAFVDCTFRHTAGVFTGAQSPKAHIIAARDSSTAVLLQRCTFPSSPANTVLLRVNSSSALFADDPGLTVWDSATNRTVAVEPLSSVPSRPLFLRADDPWFLEMQQALLSAAPPAGGDADDTAYIGVSAAVMAVLAAAVCVLAFIAWRLRRRGRRRRQRAHTSLTNSENNGTEAEPGSTDRSGSTSASRHHCRISTDPDAHKVPTEPHPDALPPRPLPDATARSESALGTTIESSTSTCSTKHVSASAGAAQAIAATVSTANPANATSAQSSAATVSTANPVNATSAQSSAAASVPSIASSAPAYGAYICAGSGFPSMAPSSGDASATAAASTGLHTAPHTAPLHPPLPTSFLSLSSAALAASRPGSADCATLPTGFPVLQKFSSVATCQSTTQLSVEEPPGEGPRQPDRPAPAQGAPLAERMEHAQYQLDTLEGLEVLDGLVLQCGAANRLHGGQAVIQFAKDKQTHEEFAIKVFLSRRAFEDEARLYEADSCPLGHFLPQVRDIVPNRDAQLVDAAGSPLPPCIVMEKGESLDVWMLRSADMGIDMVTGLQVVTHISQRLLDLHAAGYVHRDLKPSNIMWLPRGNRWTLIDFGCAARAGAFAPLSFSLAYAAPEVVEASQAGAKTIEVTAAMDSWALGVVAVELFSNDVAVDLTEGTSMVRKRIRGELPLPWEDPEKSPELFRCLGRFKGAVMALLRRDAAQRISVGDFVRQARRVLTHTTNTTSDVS